MMKYSIEDTELVNSRRWYVNGRGYFVANDDASVSLHRLIMGNPKGSVDHINGDKLDNRRENLRVCNQSQNCANSRISKNNTSGYKGVSWNKALCKWQSYIMVNRQRKHLGYFISKSEAAITYNRAASQYFGEFARLNEVNL